MRPSLDRLRERAELAEIGAVAARKAFHDALEAARGGAAEPRKRIGWPKGMKRGPRKPPRVAAPALPSAPDKPKAKYKPAKDHPFRKRAVSAKPGRVIETVSTPPQNPATEAQE